MEFKRLTIFDLFIWLFILFGQIINVGAYFLTASLEQARYFITVQAFLLSIATLFLLHRWVANGTNWLFLVIIGVFQIVHFFAFIPHFIVVEWSDLVLLTYLPFILLLHWFRKQKIKKTGKELAIPFRHEGKDLFGDSAELTDIVCLVVSLFVLFGIPRLVAVFF